MAVFVRQRGLVASDEIAFETQGGCVLATIEAGGSVCVRMGIPRLEPDEIPIASPRRAASYRLDVDGEEVRFAAVSMGNPHAVVRVADVESAPVARLGPALQAHPFFPESVNVGFAQPVSRDRLRLRVFERGVGETRACGSGACAAVVAGQLKWRSRCEHAGRASRRDARDQMGRRGRGGVDDGTHGVGLRCGDRAVSFRVERLGEVPGWVRRAGERQTVRMRLVTARGFQCGDRAVTRGARPTRLRLTAPIGRRRAGARRARTHRRAPGEL